MVLDRLSFGDNDQLVVKPISKFRVKRIALEPHQVPYYYGLSALTSDVDDDGEQEPTTTANRTSNKRRSSTSNKRQSSSQRRRSSVATKQANGGQEGGGESSSQEASPCNTTSALSVVPSFRCSLSNSVFQSSYEEGDIVTADGQEEEGFADLTKATQTDENADNFPLPDADSKKLLRYSFPANVFHSNNAQNLMELGNQFIGDEDRFQQPSNQQSLSASMHHQQQGRQSGTNSEVAPSFRCSLPAAAFQSHLEEDGGEDTVFQQLQHARQIYSQKARKSQGEYGLQASRRTDPSLGSLPASAFQSTMYESTNSLAGGSTRTTFGEGQAHNIQTIDDQQELGNRGRSSTVTNPFRTSFPASAFQSTYYENISNDHEEEEIAPSSQDAYAPSSQGTSTTKRPSSFHCTLAKSAFQSTYLDEDETKTEDEKKLPDSQQLPDSQGTEYSPPKFRTSLAAASVFQSTYYESTVGEEDLSKQLDQTEPAVPEAHPNTQKEPLIPEVMPVVEVAPTAARKSTILYPIKPNELINFNKPPARPSALEALVSGLSTKQPINFGVFQPQKQQQTSKRLSVDKAVQYSPPEIVDKHTPFKQMIIEEIEENSEDYGPYIESPDQTLSADELKIPPQPSMKSPQVQPCVMVSQLSEGIANLSLPVSSPEPVYSPQQQVQRPVSPKKTKENEDETPKTPSPDMTLKSVLKRHRPIEPSKEALRSICLNYNTPSYNNRRKSVLFADKTFSQSPPIYNTTVESAMDQTMALEMETVRLNNTNLGANISKLSRGSLCHGESLLEDETFSEKVSNKQQPSAQIPNFADSSLWDAGGGCDYDDDEEEHQERQEQASGFFSRTKEWPSVVDNSLGLENSHLMSEDSPSAVSNRTVVRQISKESRMSSPLSTSMAVFDSTSDNCFASPAVKHIVLRANKNKPSPALVLPKPKILHNNMDSPSVVELGLRRSNRNRLPRLNQALGQHPIYERDAEGNETLVGANDVVIKDKLLKKHKVADPLVAEERDRELKNRRRLQHDKKDELRKRRFH